VSLLIWALLGWLLVALYFWPPEALAPFVQQAAFLSPYLLLCLVLLALVPTVTWLLWRLEVLLVGALLFGALLPLGIERLAVQRSPKEMGLTLRERWQPGAALVGFNLYSQGLSFYSGQVFHLLRFRNELNFGEKLAPDSGLFLKNFEALQTFSANRPLIFFYLKSKDFLWLKRKLPREYEVLARQNDCFLVSSQRQ